MKITTEFNEWFNYFDIDDVELVHQMYITVRDGRSQVPFEIKTDGEKITLACSMIREIQLLIASDKARICFFREFDKWAGDIELKYELAHSNTGIEQKKDEKIKGVEMMYRNVWKFGSRWSEDGDPNTRIADSIFKKYNVAFAASDDVTKVKKGDLIEIGDSDTVIAIGEALSDGESINQFGLAFVNEKMKEYLIPGAVYGCTVHYYWLSDDEKFTCKTGRFHSETLMKEHVNKLFDKLSKK